MTEIAELTEQERLALVADVLVDVDDRLAAEDAAAADTA